jgi:serine/threonine-protein kinase
MNEGEPATEPKPPTLQAGEIVADKYRIERLIGSGGMAEVYAAVNIKTDRRVALKWILPVLASSREVMLRFRREALAAGRISHPNVVAIFDVVEHQGSACMVMELLDGEMLSDRLLRTGPLPFVEAVAIILPAMRGVAAAHAQGVIHRDIKPHNIFLCLDGGAEGAIREVKVLDFGVSKLTVADAATVGDITLSGNVVGTPEYMAPEQVRAGKGVDHRIDVYSLGVVLYEMLAGRPPYVNQHFSGLMLEIMQHDPPPLARFRPDVPRRLAGVIQRSMVRDPDRRFPDVPAFIQALEMVARDDLKMIVGTPPEGVITRAGFPRPTPTPSPGPGSPPFGFPVPRSKYAVRALVAGVFMAAGISAFAMAMWHWRTKDRAAPSSPAMPRSALAMPAPPTTKAPPPPAAPFAPPPAPALAVTAPPPAPGGDADKGKPAATAELSRPPASRPHAEREHEHDRDRDKVKSASARPAVAEPILVRPVERVPPTVPPARPARAGKLSVDDF